MNLRQYSTLIFDCDGVILDSNRIKTEAFRIAAQPYGSAAANALVDHHIANGGISRYKKFRTFLEVIVPQYVPNAIPVQGDRDIEQLLTVYANAVRSGLMTCEVANGLEALRASMPQARWLIVSGGDQEELRHIFAKRGIESLFDGGIYGSPDSKSEILRREIDAETIKMPALFLGDSRYDYEVAKSGGLDFVFIHGWTELPNWQTFVASSGIQSIHSLHQLLP